MTDTAQQNGVQVNGNQPPANVEPSPSERFTRAVIKEFSGTNGGVELTSFQRKLIQNYFIRIDMSLKVLEGKRMAKKAEYRDPLAFDWRNVNIPKLAVDVITYSSVGLDPAQPNHINPIPWKNNNANNYEINFIMGYRGIELKSKKYGLDVPDDVVVELVYSKDVFKQFKKDMNNKVENYIFEVVDDFDRGEIRGGFYYHKYFDKPEKNKLKVFSMKDIEKRRPEHASAEFWGGEKDNWVNGQKQGKIEVEGWADEMAWKTVYRAAWNAITIDSEKIDENFLRVIERERDAKDLPILTEIKEEGNKTEIGFEEDMTGQTGIKQEGGGEQNEDQQHKSPAQETGNGTLFQQEQPEGKKPRAPF